MRRLHRTIICLPAIGDARFAAQYQMTAEVNQAINGGVMRRRSDDPKGRMVATRWMTKSTKEFMTEGDAALTSASPTESTAVASHAPAESQAPAAAPGRAKQMWLNLQQLSKEIEDEYYLERKRLETFDKRRWRKNMELVKRQGVAFIIVYVATYIFCFVALYLAFATGWAKKENAFECWMMAAQGCVDRDNFYEAVERWDTYINVGFAFAINEMMEVWRFSMVFFVYAAMRKKTIKWAYGAKSRPTLFRQFAPH